MDPEAPAITSPGGPARAWKKLNKKKDERYQEK